MRTLQTLTVLALLACAFAAHAFYQYKYHSTQILSDALIKAEKGDTQAQVLAGDIYLLCTWPFRADSKALERHEWDNFSFLQLGLTSKCNPEEGVRWYRAAAEAGDAQGQLGYALILLDRRTTSKEKWAQSVALIEKAAGQGNIAAAFRLGESLRAKEPEKSVKWYTVAASHGHQEAQSRLADMHEAGSGIAQDSVEAYYWSLVAIRNGRQNSAHVEKYFSFLSDEQKSAARKRAAEWKPE